MQWTGVMNRRDVTKPESLRMTDETTIRSEAPSPVIPGPTFRQAALATIVGYVLSFGTGFASFHAIPKLLAASSAAQTTQNILASPGLFAGAIFAMLSNFVGDILAAWGLYVLLRPVNASWSLLVAWFRVVYTAIGLTAVLNLVTAHDLLADPDSLAAMGQAARDVHVHAALIAFQAQFGFSLILFGLYLAMLGWLFFRSGYLPKWLGLVLVIDGVGWVASQSLPYLFPHRDFGFLLATSLGELVLLIWVIGWGLRLKEPARTSARA
jgi:hypothetical protein